MKKYAVGFKFGKLSVLSRFKKLQSNKKYQYYVICKCECGNIKTFLLSSLSSGSSKSCGCVQYLKPSGENNPCFRGYKEISGKFWNLCKKRSIKRNLDFLIDIKDAWELYEKQEKKCALTGIPIFFSKISKKNTASLDRIDSLKGYTIDNIQWVHKDVNIMKNSFDQNYFIHFCNLIALNYSKF